jgi:hypothetical protein
MSYNTILLQKKSSMKFKNALAPPVSLECMGRLKLIEAHTFGYKILRTQKCAYMSD